jgi:hypothetical protein
MEAREFETTPQQGKIKIPADVPDGVRMRVVLLWDATPKRDADLKRLFESATEGLVDEDLVRTTERGREDEAWAF